MIIDSSAILAVIGQEPGYGPIIHALATSPSTRIGALLPPPASEHVLVAPGGRGCDQSVTVADQASQNGPALSQPRCGEFVEPAKVIANRAHGRRLTRHLGTPPTHATSLPRRCQRTIFASP